MTPQEMLNYAQAYRALWGRHDLEGLLALHHSDCELHILGSDPVRSREAIRQVFADLFELIPDLHFEGRHLYAGEDHFVSEWSARGTPKRELSLLGLEGTPQGEVHCNGTAVFTVRDGLITSKRMYWDTLAISRQLSTETGVAGGAG